MPGEISRSNPGPGGNTPLVPSWIEAQNLKDEKQELLLRIKNLEQRNNKLKEACEAVNDYFNECAKTWAANDGRVKSESGAVVEDSEDIERLCNIAGIKVKQALKIP